MINCTFAVLGFPLWSIFLIVASAVAVFLFLKANPKKRAKLDAAVDKAKDVLKK